VKHRNIDYDVEEDSAGPMALENISKNRNRTKGD
jgi:hypothetical protein